MRLFMAAISSLFIAGVVLASPSLAPIETPPGQTTGKHIVQLKDDAKVSSVLEALGIDVEPEYKWEYTNGFAGKFDEPTLAALRASPDLEFISEDGVAHAMEVQTDAPWGLARISNPESLRGNQTDVLQYQYNYHESAGAGVDIYVVDTGIRVTHRAFGGRAKWGATFGGYENRDGNGHGTHCAGTAAGDVVGVARNANLIAVKVLSDGGDGTFVDIISGLNWIMTRVEATRRPSVISMSLGGGASPAIDRAVEACARRGIHVIAAAGNDNQDASSVSPARSEFVITVGATTINDARAWFSNYGSVVDIWAPGERITSAWYNSDNALNTISGTSMAAPHVSGIVAYLLSLEGNMSPREMSNRLKQLSQENVITGIPTRTPNRFAQNGFVRF